MPLIAATATFTPAGDAKRLLDLYLMVQVFAGVRKAQAAVVEEAKTICPVDTGELRDSIAAQEPTDDGHQITGEVAALAGHAGYVEFGTGRRGAESAGAGPYDYTMSWPGMVAQPYLRPALDSARAAVLGGFSV